MTDTETKRPTEALLHDAAEKLTAGPITEETAHDLRLVLKMLASLIESTRIGERTEPLGLLPLRSRELARSILDV